jgi:hypothetical protein
VSVQDRCMICARRPIGLEMFCTHLIVALGDEVQVEARFGPIRDSTNLDTR